MLRWLFHHLHSLSNHLYFPPRCLICTVHGEGISNVFGGRVCHGDYWIHSLSASRCLLWRDSAQLKCISKLVIVEGAQTYTRKKLNCLVGSKETVLLSWKEEEVREKPGNCVVGRSIQRKVHGARLSKGLKDVSGLIEVALMLQLFFHGVYRPREAGSPWHRAETECAGRVPVRAEHRWYSRNQAGALNQTNDSLW